MNAIRFYNNPLHKSLVDDLFNGFAFTDSREAGHCGCVPSNIAETGKDFRISMMVPGYRKEDITINVQKNVLTIKSEGHSAYAEDVKYLRREFEIQPFERDFILSKHVDADGITAAFTDGILEIVVPKKEEMVEKASVQIEIQ